MREFNAILESCRVLRNAQSFFESMPEDMDWTVLGDVSSSATKEANLFVKTVLMFLWS